MAQLPLVAAADGDIELAEQFEAYGGDADLDHAAIFGAALASDEAALFELIQEARDVWCAGNEALRNGERGQWTGMLAAQKTKSVVLLGREIELAEELVF